MNISINGGNEGAKLKFSERREGEILYIDVNMRLAEEDIPERFSVKLRFPKAGAYSVWSPAVRHGRYLAPSWRKSTTPSRLASWMPLHSLLSADGKNRILIALSDAFNPTEIATGVVEADGTIECIITFFTNKVAPISEYSATVRIDERSIPYYDSVYDAVAWWENVCGYTPTYVPEHARLPMNSLWYSYHQNLDVEDIINECRLSKPLGMDTVIIDDGWQTDNSGGGYAYCGDWKVAKSKISDMREFVERIHNEGMKVMLWFSVPFIGVFAENYSRFKKYILDGTSYKDRHWALDPRYKEVRDFLVKTYTDAVKNWNLDGLKLDFIDHFKLLGKSLEYDEERDHQSLEDAIDALMTEILTSLKAINPDILIEFRQTYVGPAIRKYGNMLRVTDCPGDAILNRQDIINLRLTSGKTAVHSDMLMWHLDESAEEAALQIVSSLYSVPQISMKIRTLPEEHKKMLAFYLSFWRENREVLLDGKIIAANPEGSYSRVAAALGNKAIFTAYTDTLIDCQPYSEIVAVNSSASKALVIKGAAGKKYTVKSCIGAVISEGTVDGSLAEVEVPLSGMVIIN